MMDKKKRHVLAVLIGILFLIQLAYANPIINGDTVYIDDSRAYISATPHTLYTSGWVTFIVKPKTYTGNINGIWGFDTTVSIPTKAEYYNRHNITISKVCNKSIPEVWYTYTLIPKYLWCWQNITQQNCNPENTSCQTVETPTLLWESSFQKAIISKHTIYYNLTEEWTDISNRFNSIDVTLDNKNRWYYITNIPVIAGNTYTMRAWVNVPVCLKTDVSCRNYGKYDFALYPSSYGSNILQAYLDGNLYLLDPWWNTTWHYRTTVTITAHANITQYPMFLPINFTNYIGAGEHLIANSIRILETDISGISNDEINYYFFQGKNVSINTTLAYTKEYVWDNSTNAIGTILWTMNGTLANTTIRYYMIYFDVSENGVKSAPTYTGVTTQSDGTYYIIDTGTKGMDYGIKKTRITGHIRPNNISVWQSTNADDDSANILDTIDDNGALNNKYQEIHALSPSCDWQLNNSQIVQINCTTWDCFGSANKIYCHQNVSCIYGAGCFINWKTYYTTLTANSGSNYFFQLLPYGVTYITEAADKNIITYNTLWTKGEALRNGAVPTIVLPPKYVAYWETAARTLGNGQNGYSLVEFRMDDITTTTNDWYQPAETIPETAGKSAYKQIYLYWLHNTRPFSTNATFTFDQMARSFLRNPPSITLGALEQQRLPGPLGVTWGAWSGYNDTTAFNTTTVTWNTNATTIGCNLTLWLNGERNLTNTTDGTSFSKNFTNMHNGNITMAVTCYNATSFGNSTLSWWNISWHDITSPSISWGAWYGYNITIYSNTTTVTWTTNESATNCTIYMNYSIGFWHNTTFGISFSKNFTNIPQGNYTVNITCRDPDYNRGISTNSFLNIRDPISMLVTTRIWEEIEKKVLERTNNTIVTERNYDIELIDPYINELGWILYVDLDHNGTNLYVDCNMPFASGEKILDWLNYGNWMGDNLTVLYKNLSGGLALCNKYWFRGEYINGSATVSLPWASNYTIFFVSGTMTFENDYSPPHIIHGDITIPFGVIEFEDTSVNYEIDLYVSHEELDWWKTLTSSLFAWMFGLFPLILFFFLLLIGFDMKFSLIIAIGFPMIVMLLKMLGI